MAKKLFVQPTYFFNFLSGIQSKFLLEQLETYQAMLWSLAPKQKYNLEKGQNGNTGVFFTGH